MNPLNPVFSILAFLMAVVTSLFIAKKFPPPILENRYSSIDGLRGYLAFAVFLHHSAIWYYYLQSGKWVVPPSNLYTHFGQTSVALFFMITGFLFYTKLIESRAYGMDWGKFFISRLFRLLPLYLFAVLLLILITTYRSNGILNEPTWVMTKNLIKWLTFTMFGAPGINGFSDTWVVMAGVTWSLPYEWFFYLALPIVGFTVRSPPPIPYLLIGCAGITFFFTYALEAHHLLAFGGGIFASVVIRYKSMRQVALSWIAPPIIATCFIMLIGFFPTAYDYPQLIIITIAFTLIAGGCSIYGLLTSMASKMLGEMAYSIYLLHGIILFSIINLILGVGTVSQMSPLNYWLLILGITPITILISFVTFNRIEKPSMIQAARMNAWFRRRFAGGAKSSVLAAVE